MIPHAVAFAGWQARLDDACRGLHAIRRVVALAETASTQDAPKTRAASAGTLVTAWRQTAGRGRFGRHWADTGTEGVAASFVVEAQSGERLALHGLFRFLLFMLHDPTLQHMARPCRRDAPRGVG